MAATKYPAYTDNANSTTFTGGATNFATVANLGALSNSIPAGTNIASLNGTNVFTGTNRFTGTVIITNTANTLAGTISGNGAGLTNIAAGNVASGTLADARLSANVPLLNAVQTFSGATNTFTGSLWATNSAAWIKSVALGDSMVSGSSSLVISRNAAAGLIQFANSSSSKNAYLQWATTTDLELYYNDSSGYLSLRGANVRAVGTVASTPTFVAKAVASQTAAVQEWQNSSGTVLLKVDKNGVVVFPTNSAAPSTITGSAQLWSEQVSGTAELKVKDGAGNVTQLSPHARGSLPPEGAAIDDGVHEFPIIVHHQNIYVGKEEWVNLSALAADLEKVTGKKYVFQRPLAGGPVDWDADQERQANEWRAEAKRTNDRLNERALAGDTNALAGLVRTNFVKLKRPNFLKLK